MQRENKTKQHHWNVPTRQFKRELQQKQKTEQQNEPVASASTQYSVKQYMHTPMGISPIKTHRARITYDPEPQKHIKSLREKNHDTDVQSDSTEGHKYTKTPKKNQRLISSNAENEVKQIGKALEGNCNAKRQESAQNITSAASNFRRSRTIDQIEKFNAKKTEQQNICSARIRSKSTPRSSTNTAELKNTVQNVKRRSTNAIHYMQKEKHQSAFEKEQIKKRLEALRKSTKKILNKNIMHKQTKHVDAKSKASTENIEAKLSTYRHYEQIEQPKQLILNMDAHNNDNAKNELTGASSKGSEKAQGIIAKDAASINSEGRNAVALKATPLLENSKRVGLLRKPETHDHSYSAIKEFSFDKENVAREMLTPKIDFPQKSCSLVEKPKDITETNNNTTPSVIIETANNINNTREAMDKNETNSLQKIESSRAKCDAKIVSTRAAMPINETNSLTKIESSRTKCDAKIVSTGPTNNKCPSNEIDLQVPSAQLISKDNKPEDIQQPAQLPHSVTDAHKEDISNKNVETNELPFWLKPSSVQVYPYNFIMAVRRKLEAIAFPEHRHETTNETSEKIDLNKKHHVETFSAMPKKKTRQHAKRRLLSSNTDVERSHMVPSEPKSNSLHDYKAKKDFLTDMESNFSSISLQLPTSNTVSEISSLHTESIVYKKQQHSGMIRSTFNKTRHRHEDDEVTTISSSVFGSPEKKPPSKEDFCFVAPRPVSPLSVERIEKLKIKSKSQIHTDTNKGKELESEYSNESNGHSGVNLNQLLDDFNRSLSQVIEVNAQLKSTLDRSHKIFSPERRVNIGSSQRDYTTDFEPIESQEQGVNIGSSLRDYTTDFETVESKSKTNHSATMPLNKSASQVVTPVVQTELNLDLDLRSLTNSSVTRTPTTALTESINEEDDIPYDDHHITDRKVTLKSPTTYEKQMESIEQLKANLHAAITAAQKNRINAEQSEISNKSGSKSSKCIYDSEDINIYHENQKCAAAADGQDTIENTTASASDITYTCSKNTSQTLGSDNHNRENPKNSLSEAEKYAINSVREQHSTVSQINSYKSTQTSMHSSISEELPNVNKSPTKHNNNCVKKSRIRKSTIFENNINTKRGDYPQSEVNALEESKFYGARKKQPKEEENLITRNTSGSSNKNVQIPIQTFQGNTSTATHSTYNKHHYPNGADSKSSMPGSEIIAIFNKSDIEVSIMSSRNSSISESSINYSCVGLFEKLIKNETTKSEYLTALLKMREKALLDRTRGQLAWLEVQKERYKAKGLLLQITTIKKKQRGILLKMEKEREEIKRLLQTTTASSSTQSTTVRQNPTRHTRLPHTNNSAGTNITAEASESTPPATLPPLFTLPKSGRKSQRSNHSDAGATAVATPRSAPIVRADYALESSRTLEELLLRRESDLRKRRAHVERLMQWHRKLDQEEAEVMQMERMLLDSNNVNPIRELSNNLKHEEATSANNIQSAAHSASQSHCSLHRSIKMERRLKEIDKSLQELQNITSASNILHKEDTSASMTTLHHESTKDYVRTTGSKLNKLWRRLTAQQIEKFEPNRRYKLCKTDLERLYEEAKSTVLRDFAQDEERMTNELLERSSISNFNNCNTHSTEQNQKSTALPHSRSNSRSDSQSQLYSHSTTSQHSKSTPYVPELNLSISSAQSEHIPAAHADQSNISKSRNHYSPSIGENDMQICSETSYSMEIDDDAVEAAAAAASATQKIERNARIEQNVQTFLQLSHRLTAEGFVLQRSLSDTQLNTPSPAKSSNNISTQSLNSSGPPLSSTSTGQSARSIKTKRSTGSSTVETNSPEVMPKSSEYSSSIKSGDITSDFSIASAVAAKSEVSSPQSIHHAQNRPSVICSVGTVSATLSTNTSQSIENSIDTAENIVTASPENAQLSGKSLKNSECQQTEIISPNKMVNATENVKTPQIKLIDSADSYSDNFENISSEVLSPSGSTLKSYSSAESTISSHPAETTSLSSNSSTSTSSFTIMQSKNLTMSPSSPKLKSQSALENCLLDTYEADFESISEETTRIDDLSLPKFDSSLDATLEVSELDDKAETSTNSLSKCATEINNFSPSTAKTIDSTTEHHTSIVDFAPSSPTNNGSVTESINPPRSPAEKSELKDRAAEAILSPPPPPPPPPSSALPAANNTSSAVATAASPTAIPVSFPQAVIQSVVSTSTITTTTTLGTSNSNGTHLMPDIINELELRRCQQVLMDNEQLKQFEHVTAVPYMYVREIPNKPPPPYVPPEHGSPMTTIFPSEERIKDITFRRTHELYCELTKTDYVNEKGEKLPTVMSEKITNIYERIILDICREYLEEHNEILQQGDPINFHKQLQFFNPPDRLRCIQQTIYKEVRRCLAMDKTTPKRTQVYSIYGQRAKRDHIGKIIIQEMYDEDDRWCNFHREEHEVLDLILEEMITQEIGEVIRDVFVQEGGIIESTIDMQPTEIVDSNKDLTNTDLNDSKIECQIEQQTLAEHEANGIVASTAT